MLVIWRSYVHHRPPCHVAHSGRGGKAAAQVYFLERGNLPGLLQSSEYRSAFQHPPHIQQTYYNLGHFFQFHFLLQVLKYCCYKILNFYKPMYICNTHTYFGTYKYIVLPFFVQLAIAIKYCRLKVKTTTAETIWFVKFVTKVVKKL